eukprot:SAG22_NODE_1410_length_4481_cov_10.703788_5_plen_85_part_00
MIEGSIASEAGKSEDAVELRLLRRGDRAATAAEGSGGGGGGGASGCRPAVVVQRQPTAPSPPSPSPEPSPELGLIAQRPLLPVY